MSLFNLKEPDLLQSLQEYWKQKNLNDLSKNPIEQVGEFHQLASTIGGITKPSDKPIGFSDEGFKQLSEDFNLQESVYYPTEQPQELPAVNPMTAGAYAMLKTNEDLLQKQGITFPIQLPNQQVLTQYQQKLQSLANELSGLKSDLDTILSDTPKPPDLSTSNTLMGLGLLSAILGAPKIGLALAVAGKKMEKDKLQNNLIKQKSNLLLQSGTRDKLNMIKTELAIQDRLYNVEKEKYVFISDLVKYVNEKTARDGLNKFVEFYNKTKDPILSLNKLAPDEKGAILSSPLGRDIINATINFDNQKKLAFLKDALYKNRELFKLKLRQQVKQEDAILNFDKNLYEAKYKGFKEARKVLTSGKDDLATLIMGMSEGKIGVADFLGNFSKSKISVSKFVSAGNIFKDNFFGEPAGQLLLQITAKNEKTKEQVKPLIKNICIESFISLLFATDEGAEVGDTLSKLDKEKLSEYLQSNKELIPTLKLAIRKFSLPFISQFKLTPNEKEQVLNDITDNILSRFGIINYNEPVDNTKQNKKKEVLKSILGLSF